MVITLPQQLGPGKGNLTLTGPGPSSWAIQALSSGASPGDTDKLGDQTSH